MKNQNFESKKLKTSLNSKNQRDKSLPWWVEFLFVQIGLPDKLLINILKAKKNFKESIKNDKKLIFKFLFALLVLAYFYPVVKESKNNLECQSIAKDYFSNNRNQIKINRPYIRMLSTKFCNGGDAINSIESIKR